MLLQEPEPEPEEGEEGGEPKPPKVVDPNKRKLLEFERLAFVVGEIDRACSIAPKSSYLMGPLGAIFKNTAFQGSSPYLAKQLSSYVYFRSPLEARTLQRMLVSSAQNTADFLDPVDEGADRPFWSLQTSDCGTHIVARNLVWPGFEFHATAGSPAFEYAYFGSGIRNDDAALMLPKAEYTDEDFSDMRAYQEQQQQLRIERAEQLRLKKERIAARKAAEEAEAE